MKKITNVECEVVDGKLTITGDVIGADKFDFQQPVQQVTVGYLNPANTQWPRHIQLSHEAFFVKAFGNGVGIMLDDLVRIASIIEPKTTFPPKTKGKLDNTLTVNIDSELDPDLQWEASSDGREWEKIDGEKSNVLDKNKVPVGTLVRLVASSEAGSTATNPVMVA